MTAVLDARITEFAEVLRPNGLRVSTAEVQDAARAAALVGLADKNSFRAALRGTLVKRASDEATFQRAFDFFFSGAAKVFEALDASVARRIEEEGLLKGEDLKRVLGSITDVVQGMTPLGQAALQGDQGALAGLFRSAVMQLDLRGLQSPLQAGFFTRRLLSGAGASGLESDLARLEAELKKRGVSAEGLEIASRHLSAALRQVEDAARREV